METFEEIRNGTTGSLVIISHQERILSIADEIIVVADGTIRTAGPREEVLPKLLGGEYAADVPRETEAVVSEQYNGRKFQRHNSRNA